MFEILSPVINILENVPFCQHAYLLFQFVLVKDLMYICDIGIMISFCYNCLFCTKKMLICKFCSTEITQAKTKLLSLTKNGSSMVAMVIEN